ncbi:hypothetical protein AGABI1DRAFT_83096 [Agaricus bisporus var. burnettii JB137-S8]|uniref:Uncharacterized protein n=1 Tax=Agaricus bisporus var. burnettii (strain JB137-S8 / ATCC MYA-4627 / FGSC 10392) TaxID=597362 RepID=K5XEL9_AGABU|nr:uncharacterized protein AGABI1DRAFT_83096 [Agaricus bisporus var. burnettii JB137-S8]EKM81617.1 hypothetical protein AGABI1DRAFT_83096 [Agaricus bisporus var. burnettii JB137-S8]
MRRKFGVEFLLVVLVSEDVREMRGRRSEIFISRILNRHHLLYHIEMVKEEFWDMVILMDMVLTDLTVNHPTTTI